MPIIISEPIGDDLHAEGIDPTPPDGYSPIDLGYSYDHQNGPYLKQLMTVSYVGTTGLLQVPIGAPATDTSQIPCKIVRAHAPMMRKVVSYSYIRMGAIPVVPPPEPDDANLRLLEHIQMPLAAHEVQPGQFAYGLTGQYVYAMYTPLNTTDAKVFGRNPAYNAGVVYHNIDGTNFDPSLAD